MDVKKQTQCMFVNATNGKPTSPSGQLQAIPVPLNLRPSLTSIFVTAIISHQIEKREVIGKC